MFTQTARFYDAIYAARGRSYEPESAAIAALVRAAVPHADTLLDVGCGTGAHLEAFAAAGFTCRGIDADLKMVDLARARLERIPVSLADPSTFDLGERFNAVVSFSGTVAHAKTKERLTQTVARLAAHLTTPGILVVEPFVAFGDYRAGHIDAVFVDEPETKIARMDLSRQVGRMAVLDFNYLAATTLGVERYFERRELGLFEAADYRGAFEAAGMRFEEIASPRFARGLYLGRNA